MIDRQFLGAGDPKDRLNLQHGETGGLVHKEMAEKECFPDTDAQPGVRAPTAAPYFVLHGSLETAESAPSPGLPL